MNEFFHKFAERAAHWLGTAWSFSAALLIIIVWGLSGLILGFSDTWQLVINTGTTIVTFLMVFLIQNTQNREAKAMNLKLDELIRSAKGARTSLVDLEEMSDEDLEKLEEEFRRLHKRHNNHVRDEKETGRKREARTTAGQKTSGRRSS